eukprot:TRINITY_DN25244_c0_g1_i2.p1 TRINITY_DN25244_c0_g1~~TRINITY_DN25244_c0_g1_i2.p1  ORF type:complete len:377 (+),score=79.64 TRINITY_DN25244_c0_g1_i2:47-1177(+)
MAADSCSRIFRTATLFLCYLKLQLEFGACRGEESWISEADVLKSLEGKTSSAEEDTKLLRTCVSNSWWSAAREIVARTHSRAVEGELGVVKKEVESLVKDVKQRADKFAALADATFRDHTKGLDEVPCALQWAQNSSTVFLAVKYARRFSAPGAIEVVDVSVNVTSKGFDLEAFGHHSSIRKRYFVQLKLFDDVVPESSSWASNSVGRLTVTLQKAKPGKWKRITLEKGQSATRHKVSTWADMEEKWESELEEFEKRGVKQEKEAKSSPSPDKEKRKEKKKSKGHKVSIPFMKKLQRQWKSLPKSVRERLPIFLIGGGAVCCLLGLYVWLGSGQEQDEFTEEVRDQRRLQSRLVTEAKPDGAEESVGKDVAPTADE